MTTLTEALPNLARSEPREHLDPKAPTLWRISGMFSALPFILSVAAVAWIIIWLDLPVPRLLVVAVVGLIVGLTITSVIIVPGLVWRHWRYEIREDEVDMQHGIITITRTLVPMARIQHVDTRRGPLQRRFGLASVILYTAAGSSEIPALADDIAGAVRDRIAALANTHDDL